MELFRELDTDEEQAFRQWAQENYTAFSEIKGIWHPVVQNECVRINEKAQINFGQLKEERCASH